MREGSGSALNVLRSNISGGSPITSFPYTVSFWYKTPPIYPIGGGFTVSWGSPSIGEYNGFYIENYSGSFYITSYNHNSPDSSVFSTISNWQNKNIHVMYSCSSSTSRFLSANGDIKNYTATKTVGTYNRWGLGASTSSLPNNPMQTSVFVSEVAFWNVALNSTDDLTNLYNNKMSPLLVKPENLVTYAPLNDNTSGARDIVGGRHLLQVGTGMNFADNESMRYRRRSFSGFTPGIYIPPPPQKFRSLFRGVAF